MHFQNSTCVDRMTWQATRVGKYVIRLHSRILPIIFWSAEIYIGILVGDDNVCERRTKYRNCGKKSVGN